MAGLLTRIREEWRTFLLEDTTAIGGTTPAAFFAYSPAIEVLTEKLKTIDDEIARALSQMGLSVWLVTLAAGGARNNRSGFTSFSKIHAVARCMEDPQINNTGIGASDLAEIVATFTTRFTTCGAHLYLEDIRVGADPLAPLCYDVHYNIEAEHAVSISRVDYLVDERGRRLRNEQGDALLSGNPITPTDS